MKKFYALLLTLTVSALSFGQTFYSENMGTAPTNTPIASFTGWQNTSPIVYSGTGSVRNSAASTGYAGVSGLGNVYMGVTSAVGQYFQIDGLNTSAYSASDIQLSFGHLSNTNGINIVVEKSTDGGATWNPITYTPISGTGWNLYTIPGGQIPSSSTLSLRFTNPSTTSAQMRVDDIKLSNVSASCTFVFGTPTAACDDVTLALDTYTATIPFTGAGNATYVVTTTSGTVGGDNPTSVAEGNIIITGITEGTNINVTVTGGTCNLSTPVNSPTCKPENTLPYNEPFNYAPATVLSSTQKWSPLASGDDIVVTSGNLTYPGITSTGNSITFVGTGADARTPIVPVTSGTIYASFIVNVTDLSAVTDDIANTTTYTYFALFDQSSSSFTNARLWHRRNGSQSQFGISTAAAANTTVWSPNLHTPGTPVYLVLGYDFATQLVTLTENPTIGGTASPSVSATLAASISTIGGFALRQDGTNTTPNIIIDELRIDTTPNFTLATAGFNNISGLSVYPNPANDYLHITTAINGVKNIAVYDVMGKEVLNTTTANEVINVASLNAGIYLVKITEEGKTATRKLVIK